MTRVVLASASPRRRQLLQQLHVQFTTCDPDVDESSLPGEAPLDYVRRVACAKAAAVGCALDELLIAADTTVDVDSSILGKPADGADAARMLRQLSGRTHQVHTAVCVRFADQMAVDVCSTSVTFVALDEARIDWYVSTGEPLGKAGAYAVQGSGAALVSRIEGSVSNVIGLPLHLLLEMVAGLGIDLLADAGC